MKALSESALEAIGQTPLVNLKRLVEAWGLEGKIYAKLELLNPGFSMKDRIALQMIEEAENGGELKPGQTIVEMTSGNTGTGLAIVCAIKGYPFVAVMSKGNTPERARMMKALGAEVVLVEQSGPSQAQHVSGEDLALVEEEAKRIAEERGAFLVNQFERIGNVHAHEYHTGVEIWNQTEGKLDAFVQFAGTGGSFAGCARTLKKYNPKVRCYLIEPAGAPYLAGGPITNPSHKIQGGGYIRDLPLVDKDLVDEFATATDEEAIEAARALARLEGIFAGYSSGANVAVAAKLLKGKERGNRIATLICDSGLKYLSTDLFE